MIILTSPAKSLDLESNWDEKYTLPEYLSEASELIAVLQKLNLKALSKTLDISDKLAELNYQRFQDWAKNHTDSNSKPAVLIYNGDVYREFYPDKYTAQQKQYLQRSLRIITGLYGLLRPYDLIQAYRLEMKTKLSTEKGKDLYQFWGDKLTNYLNNEIKSNNHELLVSLASNEYEAAIDLEKIECKVRDVKFLQKRDGKLKNIGIFAKKARGMMIQYCVEHEVDTLDKLKMFSVDSYKFDKEEDGSLIFIR